MINEKNSDQYLEHARQVGRLLREGREALGLSVGEVAKQQNLTSWYIEKIERGELEGLAAPVYLKGFIRRYGSLANVDCEQLIGMIDSSQSEHPLPAEGVQSVPVRRAIYARAATVVAGTAMVVAPLIWWANQSNREWSLNAISDVPVSQQEVVNEPNHAANAQETIPVAASLTPVPTRVPDTQELPFEPAVVISAEVESPPTQSEPAQEHDLTGDTLRWISLSTVEDTWVEIYNEGSRIEYNLLSAGTERRYEFDGGLAVKIGNASAATIVIDGTPFDLEAHVRSNVATFEVNGLTSGAGEGDS